MQQVVRWFALFALWPALTIAEQSSPDSNKSESTRTLKVAVLSPRCVFGDVARKQLQRHDPTLAKRFGANE